MAAPTAADLLAGPRGRGLCLAVASCLSDQVWAALLDAGWHRQSPTLRAELVRVLEAVDSTPIRRWSDRLDFVEPIGRTVRDAMYWQAPHDETLVAAEPEVIAALQPIAAAILAAPATAWWASPVERSTLRHTSRFGDERPPRPPALRGSRGRLERWREQADAAERDAAALHAADPARSYSAHWWSTPALTEMVTTSSPLPGLGSTELVWQEDTTGERRAAVWSMSCIDAARIVEVDGPAAWTRLVERYPLEVSNCRRHDWYRTTGRAGRWFIPDWNAVAEDWDAVHLCVLGYLSTATRAVPLADPESATMVAGWNPDQTWWLNDVLSSSAAGPQLWRYQDDPDPGWVPDEQ